MDSERVEPRHPHFGPCRAQGGLPCQCCAIPRPPRSLIADMPRRRCSAHWPRHATGMPSLGAEAAGRTKRHRISKWRAESVSKCAQEVAREQSRFGKEFCVCATEKNTMRLAAEGAHEAISVVGKAGVFIAPIALAYVAITRPQLIASAGGWVAEQFGGNRFVGIFAVYLIGTFLILRFLRPLWWCGRAVAKNFFLLARYANNKGVAASTASTVSIHFAGECRAK